MLVIKQGGRMQVINPLNHQQGYKRAPFSNSTLKTKNMKFSSIFFIATLAFASAAQEQSTNQPTSGKLQKRGLIRFVGRKAAELGSSAGQGLERSEE
jgi:hypothetical protein